MYETFIRDDKFRDFFRLNMSDDVVHKKLVRQKLRALSRHGYGIHFPFSRSERETVRDGTRTEKYTDSEGNEREREVDTELFNCVI